MDHRKRVHGFDDLRCCLVCFEEYTEVGDLCPLVLPCGHTYCRRCLSKMSKCAECSRPLPSTIELCPRNIALVRHIASHVKCASPVDMSPLPSSEHLPRYLIHEMYSMSCEQLQHDLCELGINYGEESLRVDDLVDIFHAHPDKVNLFELGPSLGNGDDDFLPAPAPASSYYSSNSALGSAFNTGGVSNLRVSNLPLPVVGHYYLYRTKDFNRTLIRVKVVKVVDGGESVIVRLPNLQERSTTVESLIMGSGSVRRNPSS